MSGAPDLGQIERTNCKKDDSLTDKIAAAVEKYYQQNREVSSSSTVGKMLQTMKICLSPRGPFSAAQLAGTKPLYSVLITGDGTPVEMRAFYQEDRIFVDYMD